MGFFSSRLPKTLRRFGSVLDNGSSRTVANLPVTAGSFNRLGAHHDGGGVNFAVFSENADKIELCLFSPDGRMEIHRTPLPERTGSIWHGYVEGLQTGSLYGYRAHGAYAPDNGHRFNPNKLLCDPYTREFAGRWIDDPAVLGYDISSLDEDLSYSRIDSAPYVPKSVVSNPLMFSGRSGQYRHSENDLVYEAHVKGLTELHPLVPENLRGTYEGLACDPIIEHLHKLGVKAIELLPVHSFLDDSFLLKRGLRNYWGYNSIGFFAAEPRYFGPLGLAGFRQMTDRFHVAGIDVILDVVYNHSAEGDQRGATLSFRGLDNASYYRLQEGRSRFYVNDTGCGNTLNVSHPNVLRLVLDSLRFWVECMGVDGFRFDLASTLGRESNGFDPNGGFFDAIRQDPVLAEIRLIAEPWDVGPGGYQLGGFPDEFSEWNDRYRDTVRRYWRGDEHSTQELATRLLGSADLFDRGGRRSWSSVNFVAAHDGFTLVDTTRYSRRHNSGNYEGNQDGHQSNYSDNCGLEGESDDPNICAVRDRRVRNMLMTLFLSQGTPMLLAGDEFANSQQGNNNAYCQDNEIGWVNWRDADNDLLEFVKAVSDFRRSHPSVRQTRFLHGALRERDGLSEVEWTDFSGGPIDWRNPGLSNICLTLRAAENGTKTDVVFITFNRSEKTLEAALPCLQPNSHWLRSLDTSRTTQGEVCEIESATALVSSHSVAVFIIAKDSAKNDL